MIVVLSNTGSIPGRPHVSSPEVSARASDNVDLKCLVEVYPQCDRQALLWFFSKRDQESLRAGEKYKIQKRRTNTKCKTDFIVTIINVTKADEGSYSCHWTCNKDRFCPRSSSIQLKIPSPSPTGNDTRVIFKRQSPKKRSTRFRTRQNFWLIFLSSTLLSILITKLQLE